ncbi:MAG: TonB-dependent receptor [Bacteroidia bacterium]|nr:TonB-dependent receptor [Bacteroidia bacterium]
MNKDLNLTNLKLNLMRFGWLLMLGMICLNVGLAKTSEAQDWNLIMVNIDQKEASLVEIFDVLEEDTEFSFRYGDRVARHGGRYTLVYRHKSLKEILEFLAGEAGLRLSARKTTINVVLKDPTVHYRTIFAQPISIKGRVVDENTGEALEGATVQVKGSQAGAITGRNGNFTLKVSDDSKALLVSYLGYASTEVPITENLPINVSMSPDYSDLEEVVVIGYGEQSRAKINGAISKISSDEFVKYASSGFDQQLIGSLAGVQINQVNGQPGSDAQIIIRGLGTLTAGSNPLIVVDGLPLAEGSSVNSLSPNTIESISVLKDAASAAIYGSRASNGVILITTKSGKAGPLKLSFDIYSGIQMRADKVEFADAYSAAQFFTEARDWGYVSRDPANRTAGDDEATRIANGANKRELRLNYLEPYLEGTPGLTNTDWLDIIFRNAALTNAKISFSGGNASGNYFVSADYFDQDGLALGTDFSRFSSSVKVYSDLTRKLRFGLSLNPSYSRQDYANLGDWDSDPIAASSIYYPFFRPYKEDGSIALSEGQNLNMPGDGSLQENPLAYIEIKDNRFRFRLFGKAFLSMEIVDGLELKSLLGGDYRNFFYDFFKSSSLGEYRAVAPVPARAEETNGRIISYLSENTLTYKKAFGRNDLDLVAGYTYQKEEGNSSRLIGSDIRDDLLENIAGASQVSLEANRYTWVQLSYLGRFQYFFNKRYQVSAAIRRDGSSRFGDDSKWGVFPSFSAGWIISEESFFPTSSHINFAKLRLSWGQTGNNQIGSYSSKALLDPLNYVFNGNLQPGFVPSTSPNTGLSWETNTSFNVGIDFALFQKIRLSTNYYRSVTSDLLLNVPVPQQSGYSSSLQNIGEVLNEGFEFELGANGLKLGPIDWTFNANLTTNRNEVLSLAEGQEEIRAGRDGAWRTRVGGPIANITAFHIIGIYKTEDEIANTPSLGGTLTGDYIVEDVNEDGIIDDQDKVPFGTFAPELTYGLSSSFSVGNWDLSFSLNGVEGRVAYFYDEAVITGVGEGFGSPSVYYMENRYHPVNNPDGFLAQPNLGNFSAARRNTRMSSIYLQDADYLRMRYLQVGYSLPERALKRLGLGNFRMYVTSNNLFTLTKYRGYNPDSSEYRRDTDVLRAGFAQDNYPAAKSYLIGLNLGL